MKSITTYPALARLGNTMFQFAAAYAYALDHGLDFSPPSETTDEKWRALYFKHLIKPDVNSPDLKRIVIQERGYPYQPIEFKPEWAEDHLIIVDGFRQAIRYFEHRQNEVIEAFDFPWVPWLEVAVHCRRGDAIRYPEKHLLQSKEWLEAQMAKFPGREFLMFSDDPLWLKVTFGHRMDCRFAADQEGRIWDSRDQRPEVQDLIMGSFCSDHICSSSTFSVWQSILCRNPNKRAIAPKLWLVPGWESTTEETWASVRPDYFELV